MSMTQVCSLTQMNLCSCLQNVRVQEMLQSLLGIGLLQERIRM